MGHVYEFHMPILPEVQGCFTVTVTADAMIYADTETLEICTKVRSGSLFSTDVIRDAIRWMSQILR